MPLAPPVTIMTLSFSCRSMALASKVHKSAIQRIVNPGDKSGLLGTEKQGERRHFRGLRHAANRLRVSQFFEHFLLPPLIVSRQVAVHEGSVNASRRDAVAPDVMCQIIP